jgi:hypothetical protein
MAERAAAPLEAIARAQTAVALAVPHGPAKQRAMDALTQAAWSVADALAPPLPLTPPLAEPRYGAPPDIS